MNQKNVKVSIIIPAHNEESNLSKLIRLLEENLSKKNLEYELIIVNDNSIDDTGKIADELASNSQSVRAIHRIPPGGFGRAIKDGFKAAKGELLIPVMGDLSDDPTDVVKLIEKAEEGYDVVYGSRFIKGSKVEGYPMLKLFFNRSLNHLVRVLHGVKEKDITNALKVYRREVMEKIGIDNIKSENFDITLELPLKAHSMGFSSIEFPVSWNGRVGGVSKLNSLKMGPLYIKALLKSILH